MADPDKPNLIIRPYLALSHGKSYNSIEHYSECMKEYWKYGLDITDLSAYSDFKMKSDSLNEVLPLPRKQFRSRLDSRSSTL